MYLVRNSLLHHWVYKLTGEVVLRISWTVNAWAGFCVILPIALDIDVAYFLLGFLFTTPAVAYLVYCYTAQETYQMLTKRMESIKDPDTNFKVCLALERLIMDAREDAAETHYLLGANMIYHAAASDLVLAYGKDVGEHGTEEVNVESWRRSLVRVRNRFAKSMLRTFPSSVPLKIFYIEILMKDNNYALAWALADQTTQLDCSWSELFTLYCIQYMIGLIYAFRKLLRDKADGTDNEHKESINPIVLLKQSHIETKFQELVEIVARLHIRFWDLLQEKCPSNEEFEEVGFALLRETDKLARSWDVLKAKASLPSSIVALYGKFIEEVGQDPSHARDIRELLETSHCASQTDFLLFHATNGAAVLAISAVAQTHGLVRHCNMAFCQLSGYSVEELTSMPVEHLMPSIYRAVHSRLLLHQSQMAGADRPLEMAEKTVFLLHKSQHIVPIVVKVVAGPNFLNGYVFVATLTLNKDWNSHSMIHILLNPAKAIVAHSSSTFRKSCDRLDDLLQFGGRFQHRTEADH